jgi:hypothetical protein
MTTHGYGITGSFQFITKHTSSYYTNNQRPPWGSGNHLFSFWQPSFKFSSTFFSGVFSILCLWPLPAPLSFFLPVNQRFLHHAGIHPPSGRNAFHRKPIPDRMNLTRAIPFLYPDGLKNAFSKPDMYTKYDWNPIQ